MSLVLDSSVTLAFLFTDELSHPVERVWDKVLSHGAWVPGLWKLEVGNALLTAKRTGRVSGKSFDEAIADLSTYWIETDVETVNQAWDATLKLSLRHQLTMYDAAYLELAMRRGLPLATLDKELRVAAEQERIELMGL